uniref:NADH:ubiquinone oxidoreductase intermediate-associated protein 30 domain-containing protein n=1 Tax=Ditylum brightwellii TaxID=49249 RepID=A0A7S4UN97_9STRA|mmetsp:Transcript_11599/g.16953  ORF Transcript_11599/g.16953 Transcript_11599/m.16953 type:complete len:268 (-) Transcript_11599:736-1539(-)
MTLQRLLDFSVIAFLFNTLLLLSTHHAFQSSVNKHAPYRRNIKQIRLNAKEEDQQQQQTPPNRRRSVSDYMGGHHAGKFDFDTRISGVTSLNYEKSLIFDDLAGSDGSDGIKILASIEDHDSDPKWATRNVFGSSGDSSTVLIEGTINLAENDAVNSGVGVMVKNDEISWEPFYVTIEKLGQRTAIISPSELGLRISPSNGNLAPRGGANNACDESRPYSDRWEIKISKTSSNYAKKDYDACLDGSINDLCLVVRTEMDFWIWKISM